MTSRLPSVPTTVSCTPVAPIGRYSGQRADHRRQADDTNIVSSVRFADDEDVRSISELSMGPFCVTRSNPTHYKWKNLDPTRPNPIQLAMELTVW